MNGKNVLLSKANSLRGFGLRMVTAKSAVLISQMTFIPLL